MTNREKPAREQSKSQILLCRWPIGFFAAYTPGNVMAIAITMSAPKRYPLAIKRVARVRNVENWANRRIAVINTTMKLAVNQAGGKLAIGYGFAVADSGKTVMR